MESPTLTPHPVATATPLIEPGACPSCGALLAVDQRYCLQCGERRGEPRVPLMPVRPAGTAAAATPTPVAAGRPRSSRGAAGTTLVAGVGTLLMALGVGVLIGHSAGGGGQQAKAPAVQVVTVAGGGASGAGSGADAAGGGGASADASGKSGGKNHGSHGSKSKQAASDIVAPASGKKLPKKVGKVVKPGDKGHGPGYENGQFTGDFFGQ